MKVFFAAFVFFFLISFAAVAEPCEPQLRRQILVQNICIGDVLFRGDLRSSENLFNDKVIEAQNAHYFLVKSRQALPGGKVGIDLVSLEWKNGGPVTDDYGLNKVLVERDMGLQLSFAASENNRWATVVGHAKFFAAPQGLFNMAAPVPPHFIRWSFRAGNVVQVGHAYYLIRRIRSVGGKNVAPLMRHSVVEAYRYDPTVTEIDPTAIIPLYIVNQNGEIYVEGPDPQLALERAPIDFLVGERHSFFKKAVDFSVRDPRYRDIVRVDGKAYVVLSRKKSYVIALAVKNSRFDRAQTVQEYTRIRWPAEGEILGRVTTVGTPYSAARLGAQIAEAQLAAGGVSELDEPSAVPPGSILLLGFSSLKK